MSVTENFEAVSRMYETIWKHKEKPVYIVFYDVKHRDPFYIAYKIKDYELPMRKGKNIWAYDNEIHPNCNKEQGFKTLTEAMLAVA